MATERVYAVDRIEDDVVVLIADAGDESAARRDQLPFPVQEGTVLRVPLTADDVPDWPAARIDEPETARRLREAREILRRLSETDPSGDIEL